jgi:hypothetical protein
VTWRPCLEMKQRAHTCKSTWWAGNNHQCRLTNEDSGKMCETDTGKDRVL